MLSTSPILAAGAISYPKLMARLIRYGKLIKAAAAHPDGSTRHEGDDGASVRADAGLGRAV